MRFVQWTIVILVVTLVTAGCTAPSGRAGDTTGSPGAAQGTTSPTTTTQAVASTRATTQATPSPTPRITTVTPAPVHTGITCGSSACPPGWQCCGKVCYNPKEDPNLYCDKGTIRQKISRHTCADIQCNGLPCCDDYMHGPTCYNPEYMRCGPA